MTHARPGSVSLLEGGGKTQLGTDGPWPSPDPSHIGTGTRTSSKWYVGPALEGGDGTGYTTPQAPRYERRHVTDRRHDRHRSDAGRMRRRNPSGRQGASG